jgi:hypothetical protein
MEQVRTDGSSVGIPPVSQRRKTSKFRSERFIGREKPSNFRSEPFLGKEKTLGVPFRTISRKRKTLGIPFRTISLKRKTLGIPFRTILGREKPLEFRSKPFSKEKNLGISIRVIFRRDKTWEKRRLMLAASLNFIISRNSVPFHFVLSYGIGSSEILGITRNEHFIPWNNKNCSESILLNFFGTKFRWQP